MNKEYHIDWNVEIKFIWDHWSSSSKLENDLRANGDAPAVCYNYDFGDGVDIEEVRQIRAEQIEIQESGLSVEPEQQESAWPRDCDGREDDEGGGGGSKLEVEQNEDREERDWNDQAQGSIEFSLLLVGARELPSDTGG